MAMDAHPCRTRTATPCRMRTSRPRPTPSCSRVREAQGAIGRGHGDARMSPHPLLVPDRARHDGQRPGLAALQPGPPPPVPGAVPPGGPRAPQGQGRGGDRVVRDPPPRCHRPLGHPARGPPVSLSCTLPPPGTTCPACPSPPCASRRASACTPRSPPCPGAAPRTSPCVTGASSPRVSPEVSPTSPTSPSLRSPVRNAAPCPSHQGSSA